VGWTQPQLLFVAYDTQQNIYAEATLGYIFALLIGVPSVLLQRIEAFW